MIIDSRILKNNFPREVYSGFAEDLLLWGSIIYKGNDAHGLNKNLAMYRITPGARSENFTGRILPQFGICIYLNLNLEL